MINDNAALLLIDLQNDFCPGGSLAIAEGDHVISIANALMPYFKTIVATQDWHPNDHSSFISLWPAHCVQNTTGAAFHPALNLINVTTIIQKGTDQQIDSYSAFYDNDHLKNTGLTDWLRARNISILYVLGLATDYCVKFSCLDAIADGFTVYLIEDACRGVNLQANDVHNAVREMEAQGVRVVNSAQIIQNHV